MPLRPLLLQLALLLTGSCLGQNVLSQQSSVSPIRMSAPVNSDPASWKDFAHDLKTYALIHDCNSDLGFIVNMSLESGKNRFFVIDLNKDSLLMSGLVTHGSCNQAWLEGRKYGNDIGCGCSSLGHFRVGSAYIGKFGPAFKLHGMDSSNSNAYARSVVLHSHNCVPDKEPYPWPICQSLGCPTVSPGFLAKLDVMIKNSRKSLILWILE